MQENHRIAVWPKEDIAFSMDGDFGSARILSPCPLELQVKTNAKQFGHFKYNATLNGNACLAKLSGSIAIEQDSYEGRLFIISLITENDAERVVFAFTKDAPQTSKFSLKLSELTTQGVPTEFPFSAFYYDLSGIYAAQRDSQAADKTAVATERPCIHNSDATNIIALRDFDEMSRKTESPSITGFVTGTTIATPKGAIAVEDLKTGDFVITKDHGLRAIRWIAHKHISAGRLASRQDSQPVLIKENTFGNGFPLRDLRVSSNQKLLLKSSSLQVMFGDTEGLAPAFHLIDDDSVKREESSDDVTYVQFMCDAHEIVYADGIPTETFRPSVPEVAGLSDKGLSDLYAVMPNLNPKEPPFPLARNVLKQRDTRILRSTRNISVGPVIHREKHIEEERA